MPTTLFLLHTPDDWETTLGPFIMTVLSFICLGFDILLWASLIKWLQL